MKFLGIQMASRDYNGIYGLMRRGEILELSATPSYKETVGSLPFVIQQEDAHYNLAKMTVY